jgi:4-hydroxybenzoate polyprenyltransferase
MIKQILAVFRLVRWLNLLIIILSMYSFQFCVVGLYLNAAGLAPTLNWAYFSLLVLSTVLIAAAGNVANGYFDFEMDMEYKPEKAIIGKYISIDTAFALQMGLSVAGVLLGFFLSYHFGNIKLGYVFLSVAALLWMYSQILKKYFLIGNIVVALLSAFVFVLPVLFEAHFMDYFPTDNLVLARRIILSELKWYFLFAFAVSLMREIIKDAEDKEADAAYGMSTLAVVLPRYAVNGIIILLCLGCMVAIGFLQVYFWKYGLKKHLWYALFFLQFPLLTDIISTTQAKDKTDYHNLSVLFKLLMFFGIASLPLFYWFILLKDQGN